MKQFGNIIGLLLMTLILLSSCKKEEVDVIETPDGYELVWNDEFEGDAIDLDNWGFETGDGTDYGLPSGWGNNELQIYTTSEQNASIQSDEGLSVLAITALQESADSFTSAKLTTEGKLDVRFGRIDVRAKMPAGQGIWPAIWLMGVNNNEIDWPGCGEIDIAEVLGHEPARRYATAHFTNDENKHEEIQEMYELSAGTFQDDYHVFSLEWTPEKLMFLQDDILFQEVPIELDMKEFLRSFYLVVNVAVGGNWPGYPDQSTNFPQKMFVDYVRVFEKVGFTPPGEPPLDLDEESIGQNIHPSLAMHAIRDGFDNLGNMEVVVYGGGGEPIVSLSDQAIDGDSCLVLNYQGGSWGGAYIELESTVDVSMYSTLKFSVNKPVDMADFEVKLESKGTNASLFIKDYSSAEVENGFHEYTIPLADFAGLDLTQITIPFAIWNPQDSDGNIVSGVVLLDNVYFSD